MPTGGKSTRRAGNGKIIFKKLPPEFYLQPTLEVAKALLGKVLVTGETVGLVVETEGYVGPEDPACHAYVGRTRRNETMWGAPGHAYVYFTYGNHWMLNVVTEREDYPAAALIRAVQPVAGLELMRERRGLEKLKGRLDDRNLTNGPGKLCQAFGISGELNGTSLQSDYLYLAEPSPEITLPLFEVAETPRVGITRGTESLWRYLVRGNKYVSRYFLS